MFRDRNDESERAFAAMIPRPAGRELPTAVAVTGLPVSDRNTERLRNYFERYGEDEIQKSYWDNQQNTFFIIFRSNER